MASQRCAREGLIYWFSSRKGCIPTSQSCLYNVMFADSSWAWAEAGGRLPPSKSSKIIRIFEIDMLAEVTLDDAVTHFAHLSCSARHHLYPGAAIQSLAESKDLAKVEDDKGTSQWAMLPQLQ